MLPRIPVANKNGNLYDESILSTGAEQPGRGARARTRASARSTVDTAAVFIRGFVARHQKPMIT